MRPQALRPQARQDTAHPAPPAQAPAQAPPLYLDHGPTRYWVGADTPANRRRQAQLRRVLTRYQPPRAVR